MGTHYIILYFVAHIFLDFVLHLKIIKSSYLFQGWDEEMVMPVEKDSSLNKNASSWL